MMANYEAVSGEHTIKFVAEENQVIAAVLARFVQARLFGGDEVTGYSIIPSEGNLMLSILINGIPRIYSCRKID